MITPLSQLLGSGSEGTCPWSSSPEDGAPERKPRSFLSTHPYENSMRLVSLRRHCSLLYIVDNVSTLLDKRKNKKKRKQINNNNNKISEALLRCALMSVRRLAGVKVSLSSFVGVPENTGNAICFLFHP